MNGTIVKVWSDGYNVQCCSSVCRPETCQRYDECESVVLVTKDYAKNGVKVEAVE